MRADLEDLKALEEVWQKTLADLHGKLPAKLLHSLQHQSSNRGYLDRTDPGRFIIELVDQKTLEMIQSNYLEGIGHSLNRNLGNPVVLDLRLRPTDSSDDSLGSYKWLNPRFRFDRFLEGKSNRMAMLACDTVASQPGRTNPLYLFSEPGMGKTHLVHALTHRVRELHPALSVCCLAFADFRDEFVQALGQKKTLEFKQRYRKFDILVVEGIQGLSSTTATIQEEFFHIFNYYFENEKQLVFTAEAPATFLKLPSSLMSRMLSGLQVQIGEPEADLGLLIIQNKSIEMGLDLNQDTILRIFERNKGSIRDLEAALGRIYFLSQRGIDINDPQNLPSGFFEAGLMDQNQVYLPLDRIVDTLCKRFNIAREQILGNSRKAEYTLPRHIGMYLGVKYSDLNKSAIARYFRKSDHTTVINAERNIKKRIEREKGFSQLLQEIVQQIRKACG